MITDNLSLVRAYTQRRDSQSRYGFGPEYEIKAYQDSSWGSLWLYRDTLGIRGIVRADSWESAYESVLDEILTPVSLEDMKADPESYFVCERDYHCTAPKDYDNGLCLCSKAEHSDCRLCWKCRQQVSGHNSAECKCTERRERETVYLTTAECVHWQPNAGEGSGLVETDLNGDYLDQLTPELAAECNITLVCQDEDTERETIWLPETASWSPILQDDNEDY